VFAPGTENSWKLSGVMIVMYPCEDARATRYMAFYFYSTIPEFNPIRPSMVATPGEYIGRYSTYIHVREKRLMEIKKKKEKMIVGMVCWISRYLNR
jgi:hypothetical protein